MKTDFIKLISLVCIGFLQPLSSHAQVSTSDSTLSTSDSTLSKNDSVHKITRDTLRPDGANKSSFHLYRVNYWVSGTFCIVASAADIYAIPTIIKSKTDITPQEIQALNRNSIPAFDRWALNQNPANRQAYLNAADYSLPVVIASAGFLALDKNIKKDWFRILLMYYEMHAITFSIYNFSPFGPALQNKYRPFVYYDQIPIGDREPGNNRNSMYSGHAATAIASTFFMVKVYSDYHPEIGRKKYLLYAAATLPAFAIGYFRVKGLEHFPSDVLIGMTIGAACGILVPEIHRFKNHKVMFGVSSSPMGGGGLGMVWNMDQKK